MIAAILHLQEGAGLVFEMVHHLARGLADAHAVVDADFLGCLRSKIIRAEVGVSLGGQLFGIAQHGVDFRHGGIGLGLGLGGAAGDQDAPGGIVALELADRLARLANRF